jgi:hypothetical protein
MYRVKINCAFFVLALIAFSFSTFAGDYAVVRYLDGKAYVQGSTANERESLTANSPIFEGDNIWVVEGNMGILFGDGSLVWLSSDSHLEISNFPDPVPDPPLGLRVHLWRGLMLMEVPSSLPYESSHSIMTPAASVKVFKKGLSMIEVETVDRTRLTVLEGSAVILSSGVTETVNQREMSYAEYGYEPMPPSSIGNFSYPDLVAFRNQSIAKPVRNGRSREYIDPELYPYAGDLDYYGSWQDVASYGNVWFPSPSYLGAGWNPYYNGYWHYTPWGTTWISYEPWGWVPFHYGRWTYVIGVGWGWIPDSFFSPAWVAWYWGDGWIGWCPLGYWGPLYEPCGWYSIQYNQIYVTNVTKVVSVHKQNPPPGKPVIPVSRAGMNNMDVKKSIPKGGDVIITPHGGLNIPPSRVQDLQNKKIDFDDMKKAVSEQPLSSRDRRVSPASLDRPNIGSDAEPGLSRRPADSSPAAGIDRGAPSAPRARGAADRSVEPRQQSPDEPARANDSRSRSFEPDRTAPVREPVQTRETPRQEQPSHEAPVREASPVENNSRREAPDQNSSARQEKSGDRSSSTPPPSYSPPSASSSSGSKSDNKNKHQMSSLKKSYGSSLASVILGGSGKNSSKNRRSYAKSYSSKSYLSASNLKNYKKNK